MHSTYLLCLKDTRNECFCKKVPLPPPNAQVTQITERSHDQEKPRWPTSPGMAVDPSAKMAAAPPLRKSPATTTQHAAAEIQHSSRPSAVPHFFDPTSLIHGDSTVRNIHMANTITLSAWCHNHNQTSVFFPNIQQEYYYPEVF